MLSFSQSDKLEKNEIQECITFAFDHFISVCSGSGVQLS